MKTTLPSAKKALLLIIKNPLLVVASVSIDVITLFLYGYLTASVYNKLTEHIIIIGTLASPHLRQGTSLFQLLFHPAIKGYTTQLLLLLFLLLIITIVMFILSQSLTLYLAKKMLSSTTTLRTILTSLALASIPWTVILALIYALHLFADLRATLLAKLSIPSETLHYFLYALDIGLLLIALPTLLCGKTGLQWIHHSTRTFFTTSALLLATFFVINVLLQQASLVATELLVLLGIFLFFPALVWTRLHYLEVSNVHP